MFNIMERKFIFFGVTFWPQDFFIFAIGFLTFVVFVILFTVVFGRVFCGWACPQTVFLDLLVHKHQTIDIARLLQMYTIEPAKLLRLEAGTLSVGAKADITLIDPALEWTVRASDFQSASRNTPFDGWSLKGRAVRTIVGGKTVWQL